ncbi:hypothetical protein GTW93_23825, partial [Streptomyces sp. SID5789]|nr:hypothetical protein [Streptomyces sp. SID5789]
MFQVSRIPAARLLGAAALSFASLASLSAAHPAAAVGTDAGAGAIAGVPHGDHLTVTVRNAGPAADGTFALYCHP